MDACFVYPTPLYMLFLALHTLTMLLNATLFTLWTGYKTKAWLPNNLA